MAKDGLKYRKFKLFLQILQNLSLNLNSGETLVIFDPNGIGKNLCFKGYFVDFKSKRRSNLD
ncbi:hypothetical protein [Campylobacter concisus]|uniref:hypothetical protein n=1 Tax=Campylobacter concisus TaxID=199 RepID=UPI000CD8EE58|nr:hypothetical protein [Campylobacter concisus]